MTISDIIELANELTERKGEKVLDLRLLLSSVLMDVCKRGRHWWRKWDVTFSIGVNATTFDLTNAALFTPNTTNIGFEEIISVYLITGTTPLQTVDLTPIFDSMGIREMKYNTSQAQPSRYIIDPGTYNSLRIDPSDAAYTGGITFWGMPNLAKETTSDVVPLVPPWYHNILVEGLESRINKRVYGADDTRYIDSKETYEQSILTMMMRPQFTTNYSRRWVDDSSAVDGTGGGAVQSTSPNSP